MNKGPNLDISLLPRFKKWRADIGEENIRLWEYLANKSEYDLAAAFSKLFWPDFVEVDGVSSLPKRMQCGKYNLTMPGPKRGNIVARWSS